MNNSPIIIFDYCGIPFDLSGTLYPDNMPIVGKNDEEWGDIESILLRPLTLTDFMTAMFLADSYMERHGLNVPLQLPYIPGARQDRINPTGDYLFTAKSIAKELNLRNFKFVKVLDPHSGVSPSLIDRCEVVYSYELESVVTELKCWGSDCVISPDAGAEKRASGMAKALGVPLIHAWKTRNIKDGSISGFGIEPTILDFKRPLIVDDICDGGGTFVGLADCISKMSTYTRCDLFVTHGLFSKGTRDLLDVFDNVFCTDSMLQALTAKGVRVIPVCENF